MSHRVASVTLPTFHIRSFRNMFRKTLSAFLFIAALAPVSAFSQSGKDINNFSQAKAAAVKINQGAQTFYCGCDIRWQGKKGTLLPI